MASFILLILALFSPSVFAKRANPTPNSAALYLQELRDPLLNSPTRTKYLNAAQSQMREILAEQLSVSSQNIVSEFVKDQSKLNHLKQGHWLDFQTQFYTTLHQESFHRKITEVRKTRNFGDYGENIIQGIISNLADFNPLTEGRYYNRLAEMNLKKKKILVPHFLLVNNINELLKIEPHTPLEELFPKSQNESPTNPSLETFLKKVGKKERSEMQELSEKVQLTHKIYMRAVANSAKTIASLHYLTGHSDRLETEGQLHSFLNTYCTECSPKEVRELHVLAMTYVDAAKKDFKQTYLNTSEVAQSFCEYINSKNYYWSGPSTEVSKKPIISSTYVSKGAVPDFIRKEEMKVTENGSYLYNYTILRDMLYEHDLGNLILTDALTALTDLKDPTVIKLSCKNQKQDAAIINAAIAEAKKNVEIYFKNISFKVRMSRFKLKDVNDTLEYLAQTNVAATSEAMVAFPQGIKHVVQAIIEIDKDVKRRAKWDKIISWGGTIVGVAIMATGVFAPASAALITYTFKTISAAEALKYVIAGTVYVSVAKNIGTGIYRLARSLKERRFYKKLYEVKLANGKTFFLNSNVIIHYAQFKELEINYISDFTSASLSFPSLLNIAYSETGGDLEKTGKILSKVREFFLQNAVDSTQDSIIQSIIDFVVNGN